MISLRNTNLVRIYEKTYCSSERSESRTSRCGASRLTRKINFVAYQTKTEIAYPVYPGPCFWLITINYMIGILNININSLYQLLIRVWICAFISAFRSAVLHLDLNINAGRQVQIR